jgi:cellulose synthase/poly-beta-1,6-N-acetylglucosamine synthase-like glycosyltransferase
VVIIFFASVLLVKYMVYMLVSPWYDVWAKWHHAHRFGDGGDYNPKVSILVPAWNEAVGIVTTIESILESSYKNLEIIIVNDGSTDDSHAIIRKFIERYRLRLLHANSSGVQIDIRYAYKKNGGKGAALNTAIAMSRGSILISTDADCFVAPDAVSKFVAYFRDPRVMAAVGNVKIGNSKTLLGEIQSLEFLFSFYFKKADSLMNTIYIVGGAAGAFRREVFEKLGVYNTKNITEDIDLSVRIQSAGMRIVYAADAVVYTEGAVTLSGLMSQRLRWKRGRFTTFHEYKHLFFSLSKKHNKILTWIILPLSIFGELQLLLEFVFLLFLYAYAFVMHDFTSFVSGILVVCSMFFVQMVFDDSTRLRWTFYLLAPIGWLLFYVSTFVEYMALVNSVWGMFRKREVTWQKWVRSGVTDVPVSNSPSAPVFLGEKIKG